MTKIVSALPEPARTLFANAYTAAMQEGKTTDDANALAWERVATAWTETKQGWQLLTEASPDDADKGVALDQQPGAPNADNFAYTQPYFRICAYCGYALDDEDFCPECGMDVTDLDPSPDEPDADDAGGPMDNDADDQPEGIKLYLHRKSLTDADFLRIVNGKRMYPTATVDDVQRTLVNIDKSGIFKSAKKRLTASLEAVAKKKGFPIKPAAALAPAVMSDDISRMCPSCGYECDMADETCPECGLELDDLDPGDDATEGKLSGKQRKALPSDKFLYVTPDGKRMFPVPDDAHIRNALARIPQSKLPADVKAKILAKAKKLAKAHGIDVAESRKPKPAELVEFGQAIPIISERTVNGKKVYHGRLLVSVADKKNRNGRVYKESLWKREVSRAKDKIREGTLTGQSEHPDFRPALLDTILRFTDVSYNEMDKGVYADFDVIPTSKGNDFAEIAKAQVAIGNSTRGMGTSHKEKIGGEEVDVINDDYQLYGIDVMLFGEQSVPTARMLQFENLQAQLPVPSDPETLRKVYPQFVSEIERSLNEQITVKDIAIEATQKLYENAQVELVNLRSQLESNQESQTEAVEEIQSLSAELTKTKTALAEAGEFSHNLNTQISEMLAEKSKLNEQLVLLTHQLDVRTEGATADFAMIASLQEQAKIESKKLADAQALLASTLEIDAQLELDRVDLTAAKAQLAEQLDAAQALNGNRAGELADKVHALSLADLKIEELSKQVAESKLSFESQLAIDAKQLLDIAELREANAKLVADYDAKLATAGGKIAELSEKSTHLETQLGEALARVESSDVWSQAEASLNGALDAKVAELTATLQKQNEDFEAKAAADRAHIIEMEQHRFKSDGEHAIAKTALELSIVAKDAELQALNDKLTTEQGKVATLEGGIQAQVEVAAERFKLAESLKAELDKANADIAKMVQEAIDEGNKHQVAINELNASIVSLTEMHNAELEKTNKRVAAVEEANALQAAGWSADKALLLESEQKVAALTASAVADLDTHNTSIAALTGQLAETQEAHDNIWKINGGLAKQLEESVAKVNELAGQKSDLEVALKHHEELEEKFNYTARELGKQVTEAEIELKTLTTTLAEAETKFTELTTANKSLNDNQEVMATTITGLDADRASLVKDKEALIAELTASKAEQDKLTAQNEALLSSVTEATGVVLASQTQLETSKAHITDLSTKLETTTTSETVALSIINEAAGVLSTSSNSLVPSIRALQDITTKTADEAERIKFQLAEAAAKAEALGVELAATAAHRDSVHAKLAEAASVLETEPDKVSEAIRALQENVAATRTALEGSQNQLAEVGRKHATLQYTIEKARATRHASLLVVQLLADCQNEREVDVRLPLAIAEANNRIERALIGRGVMVAKPEDSDVQPNETPAVEADDAVPFPIAFKVSTGL